MQAILGNERVRTAARATMKAVALTVTFAVLYYAMNAWNPALAKSIGEPFGLTFRFAQVLRSFVFWLGPVVPIGTWVGSQAFSGSVGDAISFVPVTNMFIGIGIYTVSKIVGRSTVKDLGLLFVYALLTGLVVSLKLAGWAIMLDAESWRPLLAGAVTLKLATHVGMYMLGYPIARAFERWLGHGKSGASQ